MRAAPLVQVPPTPDDMQQSWLFAETFKYLYLLFMGEEGLSLDEWVLTTEAHPLRISRRPAASGYLGRLSQQQLSQQR